MGCTGAARNIGIRLLGLLMLLLMLLLLLLLLLLLVALLPDFRFKFAYWVLSRTVAPQ